VRHNSPANVLEEKSGLLSQAGLSPYHRVVTLHPYTSVPGPITVLRASGTSAPILRLATILFQTESRSMVATTTGKPSKFLREKGKKADVKRVFIV
jgi:hypothetical protein